MRNKSSNIQGMLPDEVKVSFHTKKGTALKGKNRSKFFPLREVPILKGTQLKIIAACASCLPLVCVLFSAFWLHVPKSLNLWPINIFKHLQSKLFITSLVITDYSISDINCWERICFHLNSLFIIEYSLNNTDSNFWEQIYNFY